MENFDTHQSHKKAQSVFVPLLVLMPGMAVILHLINEFNAEFMPSWYLPIGITVQVIAFGVVLLRVPKMEPILFMFAWIVLMPAMLGLVMFVKTGDPNFSLKDLTLALNIIAWLLTLVPVGLLAVALFHPRFLR